MKTIKTLLIITILCFVSLVNGFAQKNDLEISIAVPGHDAKNATEYQNHWINLDQEKAHFHVVITNTSNMPKRLWEMWNSWGWYNLTFEVLDNQGNLIHVLKKKPHTWDKNYSSFVRLDPSGHFVIDVYFKKSDWELPFLAKKKRRKF